MTVKPITCNWHPHNKFQVSQKVTTANYITMHKLHSNAVTLCLNKRCSKISIHVLCVQQMVWTIIYDEKQQNQINWHHNIINWNETCIVLVHYIIYHYDYYWLQHLSYSRIH